MEMHVLESSLLVFVFAFVSVFDCSLRISYTTVDVIMLCSCCLGFAKTMKQLKLKKIKITVHMYVLLKMQFEFEFESGHQTF